VNAVFRPQFWTDVEEGVTYLASKASPEIAVRWHGEVLNTVHRIQRLPDLGRARHDLKPRGIRSLVIERFPRYLVFYRQEAGRIEFLRVKHGMMDLPKLF
jgi:plasmid stabilization system protein ParE